MCGCWSPSSHRRTARPAARRAGSCALEGSRSGHTWAGFAMCQALSTGLARPGAGHPSFLDGQRTVVSNEFSVTGPRLVVHSLWDQDPAEGPGPVHARRRAGDLGHEPSEAGRPQHPDRRLLASGLVRASSASGPMPNSSLGPEGLSVVAAGRAVVVVGTRRRVVLVGASLVGLGVAIAAGGTPASRGPPPREWSSARAGARGPEFRRPLRRRRARRPGSGPGRRPSGPAYRA